MTRRDPKVRDKARRVVLQDRDIEILRLVLTYRAIRREDLELAFGLSLHRANKRLRALYDAGYLRREDHPYGGSVIYTLGNAALPALADATGESLDDLKSRSERPSYIFHALGLCSTSLRLQVALKSSPGVSLEQMLVERQAVDEFFYQPAGTAREQQYLIRPDAFLTVQGGGGRFHLAFEYDSGAVASKPFREKAESFKIWQDSGALKELHGEGELLVLVITGSERRIDNLQKVVRAAGMLNQYLFTSRHDFLQASPSQLLDTPLWLRGGQRQVSLASVLLSPGKDRQC
jgi:predicted DNA-binding transcriptional regulator